MKKIVLCIVILKVFLNGVDVNWDSSDVEKKEYNSAIKEYIDKTFPEKVARYEIEIEKRKNMVKKVGSLDIQIGNLPSAMNWYNAIKYCNDLVLVGNDDWRLPSMYELYNIKKNKYIRGTSLYWSATTHKTYSDFAFVGHFDKTEDNYRKKTVVVGDFFCVRDIK